MIDIDTKRNAWVTSTLPTQDLVLESMSGHEWLGRGFSYDLALLSNDRNLDLSKLLGERMTVTVQLPLGLRTFNGVITSAQYLGIQDDHTRYQVTLQPWLWLLSYSQNCRIFQNKSVPEIIKEVFRDNGFADFEEVLGTYKPVEFCVQYDESDLNFVSRLMESEGIYYFFKHEEGKHTLVMTDSYSGHAKTPGYEKVIYQPPQNRRDMQREHLSHWSVTQQIRSGSFEATDYDFKVPKAALLSRLNAPKSHPFAKGVVFEYPGYFLKKEDGDTRVRLRLEEKQLEYALVEASGDVRGLGVGALFDLTNYPREDQNKEYLVVAAHYQVHAGQFVSGSGDESEEFHGTYSLLDSTVPFRPGLHTDKPRVKGPQTATVVGPDKEEIWTDPYGRVKVRFHWDRADAKDEARSCFVRVSQVWAGEKWGSMHIPRIGQEVIVDFLEGDPDRPIITGRVYNKLQMPPYDLPANQTQSGIKSRSTPKGGPSNFNEIRFEDKKGAEQLYIQAEKNQDNLVKANDSLTVGGNRTKAVTGDETVSIGKNRDETVGIDESETIGANQTISVGANQVLSVAANRSVTVGANQTETIVVASTETVGANKALTIGAGYQVVVGAAMSETIGGTKSQDVGGAMTVTVGGASSESVGGAKSVTVTGDLSESADGNASLTSAKNVSLKAGAKGVFEAADQLTLKCGGATIILKSNGDISIKGAKITVNGSGDVVIKGSKISQN